MEAIPMGKSKKNYRRKKDRKDNKKKEHMVAGSQEKAATKISKLSKKNAEQETKISLLKDELEAVKQRNEPIVIIEKENSIDIEVQRHLAKKDLNVETLDALADFYERRTKADIEKINAEKESPEARQADETLRATIYLMFLAFFIGIVFFVAAIVLNLTYTEYGFTSILGTLGLVLITFPLGHFGSNEGTERSVKLLRSILPKRHMENIIDPGGGEGNLSSKDNLLT
jgi:hypothetical protein